MVNSGPIRPGAVLAGLEGGTLPAASCLAPEQIRLNLALRLWSARMCRQGRERGGRHLRSGVPSDDANAAARRCHCMAMLSGATAPQRRQFSKSSAPVRGGIWKRTLPCQTPGRFFRYHGPNAPSGHPFATKQEASACSAAKRTPLPCLAAGSQEKALPKKWLQALHERRGCKKQLNSKTPRFVEAFINMDTTPQTHNENFSIMAVCIKFILLHLRC